MYVVNKNNPSGSPGTSPDFTLVTDMGTTGTTITTTQYEPSSTASYVPGQLVQDNGNIFVVNTNNPANRPRTDIYDEYIPLSIEGPTGATGIAVVTIFNQNDSANYISGQLINDGDMFYLANKDNPIGLPRNITRLYTIINYRTSSEQQEYK
jgi:hypothetical protein